MQLPSSVRCRCRRRCSQASHHPLRERPHLFVASLCAISFYTYTLLAQKPLHCSSCLAPCSCNTASRPVLVRPTSSPLRTRDAHPPKCITSHRAEARISTDTRSIGLRHRANDCGLIRFTSSASNPESGESSESQSFVCQFMNPSRDGWPPSQAPQSAPGPQSSSDAQGQAVRTPLNAFRYVVACLRL